MTYVLETAETFVSDAIEGMVAVHGDLVRRVDGGVVRRAAASGRVAVITGGGSGHYPAFAGYVGSGLCTAAVVGQLFASPSTSQILRVCDEVDTSAGVVFVFGNYAGDVLNFAAAAESLRAKGIAADCLAVTDDIASAPRSDTGRRRGVAGDVQVMKVLGAAAEDGRSYADTLALGRAANERTRSLGVAFTGATMPGRHEPMFTLPAGTMGVGLGIHGEPGISEEPVARASVIAHLLVERLWLERPAGADDRLAVVLNGLGATKHEELFVLWRYVSEELRRRGAKIVEPLVGEYVTSLDMAGCSLTVLWLDDELDPLWRAPVEAPALHRGHPRPVAEPSAVATSAVAASAENGIETDSVRPELSDSSRRLAGHLRDAADVIARALARAEVELGRLDAYAGDGDHGQGMARGSAAAAAAARTALDAGAAPDELLAAAARAWADRAGGTSGALWGVALQAVADRLRTDATGDRTPASPTRSAADCARAAAEAVQRAGGAVAGDKTMLDALLPFVDALASSDELLADAWRRAAEAATRAADETKALVPRIGRARPLATRSLGHPDAGAVSLALVVTSVNDVLETATT